MDYLRTLGSAAVSSIVQKSGLNLPFTLGAKVTTFGDTTPWTLYEATKRDDGSAVSVFEFDANAPGKRRLQPLAKNALRKLRTVRHPDVLKFLDAVETENTIHVMTERVRPLGAVLQDWSAKGAQEKEDWLLWGVHRISVALAFVNDPAASTHGNICVHSVFISPSGEWKLGGFETLSNPKDEAAVLYTMGSLLPDSSSHASPEVKKGGWSTLKEHHPAVADAYALGLLLHTVFNPTAGPPPTAQPPHQPPAPSSRGAIPTSIFPAYKRLLNPNPKARLSAQGFLELGMATTGTEGGFFAKNPLVRVCAGLDNFALSSDAEKATLLRTLGESANALPSEFAAFRVLPSLVSALEYGGASAAATIPLVIRLGKSVPDVDYERVLLTPLVKLYANPDRGIRMALLEALPEYSEKLDKKMVVDKIWPHLQSGFGDTVAAIREATVKAMLPLTPKLNDRIINNDLLRHLARAQSDVDASIRTNTCILIGKMAPSLSTMTRRKVLVPAFGKALKDPFVPARLAGVMSFMGAVECFEIEEIAQRVVPAVAGLTIDHEKQVRDQAFKAVEMFIKRLQAHADAMPETVAPEEGIAGIPGNMFGAAAPGQPGTIAGSAAGAAGALAGWAYSSISKKLAASDLQTPITSSGPPPTNGATRPPIQPSLSTLSSPDVHAPTRPAGAKAMQLGAAKMPTSALAAELEREAAASAGVPGGWGDGDLMDVHADEGDWTGFVGARPGGAAGTPNLGFEDFSAPAAAADDEWGALDDNAGEGQGDVDPWAAPPPPAYPSLSTQTRKPAAAASLAPRAPATPAKQLRAQTPVSSPPSQDVSRVSSPVPPAAAGSAAAPSMAGMTKEEKAAEMARRKEERKQRIAQLKEKKAGGK